MDAGQISGIVVIFILWWWLAFLAVLPMGVKSRWESQDDGVEGAEPGAPDNPRLKEKALRASAIALVLTLITSLIIVSGVFDFRR